MLRVWLALFGSTLLSSACSTHHWAPVETNHLAPPEAPVVRHAARVVVKVRSETKTTQCVVYDKLHPVCFYNLRPALETGLVRSLWPSFPEVALGPVRDESADDYVLEVDVMLDALPPGEEGPGWSAGARSRFRLMRGGQVLAEETTASRSRAHFAYGSTLGQAATEVVDATVQHIATSVFAVPEARPDDTPLLPQVAARSFAPDSSGDDGDGRENASATLSTPRDRDQTAGDRSMPGSLAKTER